MGFLLFLILANLCLVTYQVTKMTGNNMKTLYQGPELPIKTQLRIYSLQLPAYQFYSQHADANKQRDIYFLFQFQGADSRFFRPIHPSNQSLGIYVNSIKANIYKEFDNNNDLYYFILQVKNFTSQFSKICDFIFEGAQARYQGINLNTKFSQDVSTLFSQDGDYSIDYKISFLSNPYMLDGQPIRYTLQSYDPNRQPQYSSNIYFGSSVVMKLYFPINNITDLTEYSLYLQTRYFFFDKININNIYRLYIPATGTQISDGTWNFFATAPNPKNLIFSKLQSAIGIYNNYDFIIQNPVVFNFTVGIENFSFSAQLCKSNNATDCIYQDEDFIYIPEPFYYSQQAANQNNYIIQLNFPESIEVLSEFKIELKLTEISFQYTPFLIAFNLPQDLADCNQDIGVRAEFQTNVEQNGKQSIQIDIKKFSLPSEYTVQLIIPLQDIADEDVFLSDLKLTLYLRAPNRIFSSDNLKFFIQVFTPNLDRYRFLENESSQKLNFVSSQSHKLLIQPIYSGIRVFTSYNFSIDIGAIVNQDTYVTIQVPKEVPVQNMPNIQLTNYDPGQTQLCAPFVQIQNQIITISKMVCPQQAQAYTNNQPIEISLIYSQFSSPSKICSLDFNLSVFTIDKQKQLLYNDNSYYKIVDSKTAYVYDFITNATATCLNDIQLRGIICDQLLVVLSSNSGILSEEEIVLTLPPEIIPSIDFIDQTGTPYLNNLSCKLIESYLQTSSCTIDVQSHTVTITDSQFTNNIYQLDKSIIIYNTLIPKYMKEPTTDQPPFPNDIIPFSFIVRNSLTKVNTSNKQIIQLSNFYNLPPLNDFNNLLIKQVLAYTQQLENSVLITFSLKVQLHVGDIIQIYFPKPYSFDKSTLEINGLAQGFSYKFLPHQSLPYVMMLQITNAQIITDQSQTIIIFVKDIVNPKPTDIPDDSTVPPINNNQTQEPYYEQLVKNCFVLADSGKVMTIQSVNIMSRGTISENVVIGEDIELIINIIFYQINSDDLQSYLDLHLNIPVISQNSFNQLEILINEQPTKDFQVLNDPNYINSFRFINFPFIQSKSQITYTFKFTNIKSKTDILQNLSSTVMINRILQLQGNYQAQLDSFTFSSTNSLVCDPTCLECENVSTYCTACTPDKQLDPLIPGKCIAVIQSKLTNVFIQSHKSPDSLLNFNSANNNQLLVQDEADIYFQLQIFFTGNQSYFFEIQIPKILSLSTDSILSYGQDQQAKYPEISNEKFYKFIVEEQQGQNYNSIVTPQPIPLQESRYQMIKLTHIQLPSYNDNFQFQFSVLLKDGQNSSLIRQNEQIQKNVNVECNQYCKNCSGSATKCLSCYEGDIYDPLGFYCISQPCWNGQIKIKTPQGYTCTDNDHTQTCGILYCLYCDTSPNNVKPKCQQCFYNFILSEDQEKCNFKDPNTNDKVVISNPQIPFEGKTMNPIEKINKTEQMSQQMEIRGLWKYEADLLIPPEIKLYAPVGITICILIIVYSLFNSLTQHSVSFTVETCNKLGIIEPFISFYYGFRLAEIPPFYYIQIIQATFFVIKMTNQIMAGKKILKLFRQELKQISIKDEFILRFVSYRYFFKIVQEQNKYKDLKLKKLNKQRETPNYIYSQTDKDDNLDLDDILDANNPQAKQLQKIIRYIFLSVLSSFICVLCYFYSRVVQADLYDASSKIGTFMLEYLVFYSVVQIFDLLFVIKCITIIGMYQNIYEPFKFNFDSSKQLQNDDYFELNISATTKNSNDIKTDDCQDNLSYKLESPEQSNKNTEQQTRILRKRHSWPLQHIPMNEIFQIAITSQFEKGQKRQISIPLKGKKSQKLQDSIKQLDEKTYDHPEISQFNVSDLKMA